MRIRCLPRVMMLVSLLPLLAVYAGAQTTHQLVVDIPFDFTICRQQLQAGKYTIRPISSANPSVLLVQGDKNSAEIVCTEDVRSTKAAAEGKLIFNRYGDQHFLSEMWFPGEKVGSRILKGEREEALVRELKPRKREKVTVRITEAKPN